MAEDKPYPILRFHHRHFVALNVSMWWNVSCLMVVTFEKIKKIAILACNSQKTVYSMPSFR